MKTVLWFFLIFLFNPRVQAQEAHEVLVQWQAILQFQSGKSYIKDLSGVQRDLNFKDGIYDGETVVVDPDAFVKLIDRKMCVGVLYGPAKAIAPKAEKLWAIKARAVRWICKGDHQQEIVVGDKTIKISNGEILVSGNRYLCLIGTCEVANQSLIVGAPYSFSQNELKKLTVAPEKVFIWNQKFKAPSESAGLAKPEQKVQPKEVDWRIMIGPNAGKGAIYHDNSSRNLNESDHFVGRIQFLRRLETSAFLLAFHFSNFEDENGKNNSNSTKGIHGKLERLGIEVGSRTSFLRWWSPFYRIGFSYDKLRTWVNMPDGHNNSYNSNAEYEYYSITAALGLDAVFFAKSFPSIGGYANGEIDLGRSFKQGARRVTVYNQNAIAPSEARDDTFAISTLAATIGAGVMFQF